jgi:hypothetical protein
MRHADIVAALKRNTPVDQIAVLASHSHFLIEDVDSMLDVEDGGAASETLL